MSSHSDSDSGESNRSISPPHGPVPTPGHGLRSASHSPASTGSPHRASSRPSRSRSRSTARSASADSNKSSRSGSGSRKSGSGSRKSGSGSRKSGSGSRKSGSGSRKSASRSPSGSRKSASRSRSGSRKSRSKSRGSSRSGSSRSRSGSAASNRSRSASAASNRSARSASVGSKGTRRSGSVGSHRSRSGSAQSKRSGGSRSRSHSGSRGGSKANSAHSSRSNSPNLQIDEATSPGGEKRKRESSEEQQVVRKKSNINNIIDSDSEEEEREEPQEKAEKPEVSAAAIFGDADDISSEEDRAQSPHRVGDVDSDDTRRRSLDERRHSSDLDNHESSPQRQPPGDDEKENEPVEPIPETRIDVEIPKISCDLGRDLHFVKLPNFLSVETRPFDPETYEDEIDEEETLDEEGRARLKLKVENTIRWRDEVDKEGNVKKESNARFVRWSDGSYSLHLGSEIFDVYKQPLQGDHNHLFIRQGTGLQGQAVFRTKLSFRPHSTESFTHRKMTLSLADRSQKTSGIKILSQVGADPDQDRKILLKKEEEKLRQTVRVSKPRRKGDSALRIHNTSSYREEDGSDEDGGISLNAIKNKYKSGAATASAKGGAIYSSDEEGSDIERGRSRKLDKARALDSDSGESE